MIQKSQFWMYKKKPLKKNGFCVVTHDRHSTGQHLQILASQVAEALGEWGHVRDS